MKKKDGIGLIELLFTTMQVEGVHTMLVVGKPATQDITLTLYVLAAVQSFREKITGLFIPQDLLKISSQHLP